MNYLCITDNCQGKVIAIYPDNPGITPINEILILMIKLNPDCKISCFISDEEDANNLLSRSHHKLNFPQIPELKYF